MKLSLLLGTKSTFVRIVSFVSLCVASAFLGSAAMAGPLPVLISDNVSTRAVAFESVTQKPGPFNLTSTPSFGVDPRTRVEVFAMNLDLLAGESLTAIEAEAEGIAGARYPLTVEYVGQVPGFEGIYMVVLRLSDSMTSNMGDVLVGLKLHGAATNRVRISIGTVGGGPADDAGAVPTPAPATPPAAAAQLTLAQYQAQFSNPAFPSDQDIRRFINQATWGPKGDDSDLQHIRSVGIQSYLNEQFNTPPLFVDGATNLFSNYPATPLYPISQPVPCDAICVRDNYTLYPLQKQFFTNALTQQDQLRQRVSFAIHQFIVVGGQPLNNNETSWYAPYLQTIDRNAFGNFRTLLFEITLNPGMGEYLNMRGNSAANGTPNENYPREIMQLFSIGVDTLNQNGTSVLDAQGNRVPSYDQATISNLAKIFTGWDLGPPKSTVINGVATAVTNYLDPMPLNNNVNRYDLSQKTLFGVNFPACTVVSPPCTTTAQKQTYKTAELNQAIDLLFNHANTGPFVCKELIHQLVTSNPSPSYVGRCAAAFANNGSGVRGDMKAMITAILLDPEARGDVKNDPNYGHLREPVLLMTHLLRLFNATSDGVLASTPFSYTNDLGQNLFNPPTVFSYYPADYGLPGTKLFGPEFGILDTSTTYKRANFMNTLFISGIAPNGVNRPSGTQVNFSAYQAMATNPQQLVDALNTRMMHGTMPAAMNANIVAAVTAVTNGNATTQALQRTQTAIYLTATSSQYQVER